MLLLLHLGHMRSMSVSNMPRNSFPQRMHLKVTCSAIHHFPLSTIHVCTRLPALHSTFDPPMLCVSFRSLRA